MSDWVYDYLVPQSMQTNGVFLLVVWSALTVYSIMFPLRFIIIAILAWFSASGVANVTKGVMTSKMIEKIAQDNVWAIRKRLVGLILFHAFFLWVFLTMIHDTASAIDRYW